MIPKRPTRIELQSEDLHELSAFEKNLPNEKEEQASNEDDEESF